MKIKIWLAQVDAGYAYPTFAGSDLNLLKAEIAEVAAGDWKTRPGGWPDDVVPSLPGDVDEILSVYFRDYSHNDWCGDGPTIDWSSFVIEVSGAPCGDVVQFGGLSVVRRAESAGGGAETSGCLLPEFPREGDGMESLIMALAAAGFPIHTPEFADAVQAAVDGVENNAEDDMKHNNNEHK